MARMTANERPDVSQRDVEAAFVQLHPALLRAARRWAPPESIDDAVQETWIGVINGIDRFEGRSQLSTWVFGILWRQCSRQWRMAYAKPTVRLDGYELASEATEDNPERVAETRRDACATLAAIDELPDRYREVIVLRDVLDRSAVEACDTMDLTEANQRVLLHRARTRVRASLPDLVAG